MVVRLTTKLAEVVNGVNLSGYREGDIVELPARDAAMLLAERWAEPVGEAGSGNHAAPWHPDTGAVAADRNRTRHRK